MIIFIRGKTSIFIIFLNKTYYIFVLIIHKFYTFFFLFKIFEIMKSGFVFYLIVFIKEDSFEILNKILSHQNK